MRAADIATLFEQSVIYTKTVINTLEQPFLLLSKECKVVGASACYYSLFKETAKNIQGASLYEIGNEVWNIPQLKKILKKIIVDDTAFLKGFEVKK